MTTPAVPTNLAAITARADQADLLVQRNSAGGVAVSLRELRRTFGQTRALDGLSLELAPGELVALLGPSGCGKTTALRVLAGFERVDSGDVIVDGRHINQVPAQRRDMGMVFQNYSLFPNMTALENVGFGLRMRKQGAEIRRGKASELLEMVGLAAQSKQYPHQLSGGQQQRVALARALAFEPKVLLLDEPLSALDAKVRLQLREQIRSLQLRLGTTALFVTHDQEEALSMADRVGVMNRGRLEQIAAPAELYARPATAFVAEFIGTMNRLRGTLAEGGVLVLGRVVGVQDPGESAGPDVDVLVRPEGLRLSLREHGEGIVTGKTFLGSVTRLSVLINQHTSVLVDHPSIEASDIATGTAVHIEIAAESVLVADRRAA
jgi:putative spermidine/putrescine transport system ATP-binding protein